jgi:hypothetical protein
MKNFDLISKQYFDNSDKVIINPLFERWPFRAIFIGGSGTGKTNAVMNLLLGSFIHFDKLYLIAPSDEQDKYKYLILQLQLIANIQGCNLDDIFYLGKSINDIPDIDSLDKTQQNLFIFDDLASERNQQPIVNMFIRARHANCSLIYLTQSWALCPKNLRRQLDYFMLFKMSERSDVETLCKEHADNREQFMKAYDTVTANRFQFLMLDKLTSDPNKRLRNNFGLYPIGELEPSDD